MTWTIPNILSIVRVIAAPCLALAYALYDRPLADQLALGVFLFAAVTDYVDGILARGLKQESAFGRMLDPVADKAMVLTALMIIVAVHEMQWQMLLPAALIVLREVLVSGLREFLGDVKLNVTRLAKWKTTLQMFSIGLLLGALAVNPGAEAQGNPITLQLRSYAALGAGMLGLMLLWMAAWLTLVTGFDYFAKGLPHVGGKERAARDGDGALPAETDG